MQPAIQWVKAKFLADQVTFAIWVSGAGLTLLAVGLYVARLIPQNFSGEAFYDLQFVYNSPFLDGLRDFFLVRVRSRFLHGFLISGLYSLFGYSPPAFYLVMFLTIIATAMIIVFTIREFVRSHWVASLLVMAFTWLPLNITDLLSIKKAHHIFAWLAFWVAVYLFQGWIKRGSDLRLLASVMAILCSVLAYEVAVALLPVAVFLSLSHLQNAENFGRKFLLCIWIALLASLVVLNIEGVKEISGFESTYSDSPFNLSHLVGNAIVLTPRLPTAIWNGDVLGDLPVQTWIVMAFRGIVFLSLALAGFLIMRNFRIKPTWKLADPSIALSLAAFWLALATYFPFLLAGQPPDGDSLRGVGFGIILLTVAGSIGFTEPKKSRLTHLLLVANCTLLILVGFLSYQNGLSRSEASDESVTSFVKSLKQLVPDVAEKTTLVFVNVGFGRTGCIGLMNMLYDRSQLHCIHLLAGDKEETYTRLDNGLLEDTGRMFFDNFIILTFESPEDVILLDQLTEDSYVDLPINWASSKPLATNWSVIFPLDGGRNQSFYKYLTGER